jgi:hypothetical protein
VGTRDLKRIEVIGASIDQVKFDFRAATERGRQARPVA